MMKTKFLLIALVYGLIPLKGFSQCPQCILTGDSIVSLDTSGFDQTHTYQNGGWPNYRLNVVNGSMPIYNDSVFYNGSGQITRTVHAYEEYIYTYTAGLVTRIDGYSINTMNPWTKSYNINYTAGLISSIMLDTNSVTGQPNGLPGSFVGVTWSNGNPVAMGLEIYKHLAIDTTYPYIALDTIFAAAIFDTACNVRSMLFPDRGAEGLLTYMAANNSRLTVFTDSVQFLGAGPGEIIENKVYTYNGNNTVNSIEMLPSFFDNYHEITYYFYNCNIAGIEEDITDPYTIYPNPVTDMLRFKFNSENERNIQLINSNGTVMSNFILSGSEYQIDVTGLSSGIYLVMVMENGTVTSKKFIKN